jgi:hypothetical protein
MQPLTPPKPQTPSELQLLRGEILSMKGLLSDIIGRLDDIAKMLERLRQS